MTAQPYLWPVYSKVDGQALEVRFHLDSAQVSELFRRVLRKHTVNRGRVIASETQVLPHRVE